jgi:glyoxylase-like metal-dependent hydrolase (beta-lactamase superfamily II)
VADVNAVPPVQIALPLPYLGSVNVWLLEGERPALVDAGPATDATLTSLEQQLAGHGVCLEDIATVVLTHHHLDHSGLAAAVKARSGAQIVAHRATAAYGARFHARVAAERRFTFAVMAAHGVPGAAIAESAAFFDRIVAESRPFATDRVLSDGDTVRAGDRTLRAVFRPGHSMTDTLFVDEHGGDAFVGDHLLADITSGVELMPTELQGGERRQGLMEYLGNLRKTQAMPLRTIYAGHGPAIADHRGLIDERIAFHADRLDRIAQLVGDGCRTAYDVARRLWSEATARENPVLVTWEVVGHLDVLVHRGAVAERVDDQGRRTFRPRAAARGAVR